uniref:J domain-containing protein n=1 Tax=Ditylum brightwellii TaxID=49249 RepID=A0A7S4UY41_9STRA
MRCDLTFFLCCCKSFLGSKNGGEEDFYELLGLEHDASPEEIKRAYKRQSLQMHPDKLAQRGKQVTEADQARFTRMKEAYEVLSDPHKRRTYDAVGERGMKWIEEPFSLDPQELAHNFATSSALDRSKIFLIFVVIAVIIFLLPVLVCLMVDGHLGPSAEWTTVLTPLWIWDLVILFYHFRVIMMGPFKKPDHIPQEEWVDPLPMPKRIFSLFRFCLLVIFEILVALRLDDAFQWKWYFIFIPLYIWECTMVYKKVPLAKMRIVTVEDLENALGKPFAEFTQAEKDLISKKYTVVPSTSSPQFEAAYKVKTRARQDVVKLIFRVVFIIFLVFQLDTEMDMNWWVVFVPLWLMSFCICFANCQNFAEVQAMAMEKDPELFGEKKNNDNEESASSYGAMGSEKKKRPLTNEEKEELKAQVMHSGYRMISSCCSQSFILLIACLFVGKIQGAGFSALWIISPLLMVAGIILCCLGCTIFCVTEVSDEVEFDTGDSTGNQPAPAPAPAGADYEPPKMPSENKSRETPLEPENDPDVPTSTWDPERGQVWIEPETKPLPYNRAFQATSSLTAAAESAVLAVASIAKSISKDHGQPSTDRVEPLERCSTIEELD